MLPFDLPVEVAAARPVPDPPAGPGLSLEPKLDGWRALLRTGPSARVYSRHGTDLTAAMADIAGTAARLPEAVVDGELLAVTDAGEVSFALLQTRAGKGPRPGAGFSVHFAAFDALATGGADCRPRPHDERRRRLLDLLADAPAGIRPVPATADPDEAKTWVGALGGAVEGIVAKPGHLPYLPRYGSGWTKWRRRHPVDAVVTGITGRTPATQAAVLSRPGHDGRLRPVAVSLPLGRDLRGALAPLLHPAGDHAELPGTVGGLPGSPPIPYLPVRPEVVVEIETDQAQPEFGRYRHRPRITRVRADLQPLHLTPPPHPGESAGQPGDGTRGVR